MRAAPLATRSGLLVFFLVLAGLVGVGRLAMEAWLLRPAPDRLPEIGATTNVARPFCLVIVDGLREQSAWAASDPPMPWLQAFARRGAWGVAEAGDPTLTAACVRTILTGRAPDLLTGFRNFDARPVEGSLVGYLHDRGGHPAHAGDAATFQFCRRHFAPEDVLQFPDQGPTDQGGCDDQATPFLLGRIRAGCDVVSLHLTRPDHAGHKWGAVGREYWEACRTVDEQVRSVVEAFLARQPDGTVLVAADHGVSPTGTHGGGEASARRAPFALVGPGVAKKGPVEVSQFALAPTVAALLGLPQPPLADAPPALHLVDLSEAREQAALDAYLRARLEVAKSLGGVSVDPIERRRAEISVRRLSPASAGELEGLTRDVNGLLNPNSTGFATMALVLAALWLGALVHLASTGAVAPRAAGIALAASAAAFFLSFNQAPGVVPVGAVASGVLVVVACLLTLRAAGLSRLEGAGVTLACLAALPVLTASGRVLQEAFDGREDLGPAVTRSLLLAIALAAMLVSFVRPRASVRRLALLGERAPGLIPAFGGVLLGFTLTLRPFVDPFVHLMILFALAGGMAVAWMVFSRAGRARPTWERVALLAVGLVLFGATRVAEGFLGDVWVRATPLRDAAWLFAGAGLILPLALACPGRTLAREDALGLVAAGGALLLAYAFRLAEDPAPWVTVAASAFGLGALGISLARGSPDGRLLVRLLAAVALARRLTVLDAEFAAFVVLGVGCALAARLSAPRTRVGIAWLAVGILAAKTAAFHAMGGQESFSTVDVAGGFVGLGKQDAVPLDAAGDPRVTWQVIVAGIQVAFRFALPWLLILAAAARAFERAGDVRTLLQDLAVSFAARSAAIATALWALWRQSWWMTHAYSVYALGAADVVLLLVAASLVGGWTSRDRHAEAREAPDPRPVLEGSGAVAGP